MTEKEFTKVVVQQLYPSLHTWSKSGFFKGERGLKIHYRIYGQVSPTTQPLVIAPGWTEFSLKYMELASDLIQRGFSPVYVLDYRGQGASQRILNDPEKSHVEDFLFYTRDLETFISQKILPHHPKQKLRLIAHSMGAVVALLYVLSQPNTIQSLVLSAPMLRIKSPEFLQNLALTLSPLFQWLLPQHPFLVSKRVKSKKFYSKNLISHSAPRYEFNKYLEHHHSFYLRGVTLKWAEEAIKKSRLVRQKAHKFYVPLLILVSGQDQLVDNKVIEEFCLKAKRGFLIKFPSAKHEILMEKDETRNKAIKSIVEFFKKH